MKKTVALFAILLGFANGVSADTAREDEILARVVQVLNSIKPLINAAELQQDERARMKLDYQALRADLAKIKTGIVHKFEQTLLEPRIIQPIEGDYLSVVSQSRRSA